MYPDQNNLLIVMIASTLVVAGIMGALLFAILQQFRRYRCLQMNSERLRMDALEEERKLLSADLHDDIGPLLSATLLNLGNLESTDPGKKEQLERCRQHINTIYDRIHDISQMMFPRSIERKGPLHALEEFNTLYKRNSLINVQIMPVSCKSLSPTSSLHLFRILQEILLNAIRHSKASKLLISGEVNEDRLLINSADDGQGFDVNAAMERPGLGLKNLFIRANMIGAKFRIDSVKGKGTKHEIEVQFK